MTSLLSKYTNYCDLEIGGTDFGEKIQSAYRRRFGLAKHSTARDIRNVVGQITWFKLFSFGFVRNPFTRAVSTFHFLRTWEGAPEAFKATIREFASFDDYVSSDFWQNSLGPDEILRPQIHWLRASPTSSDLLVDFVGRVESIAADISTISRTLNLTEEGAPIANVPRINESGSKEAGMIWSPDAISRIVERYKQDFDAFGYSKMPS